jgi:hypothetical protein
METVFLRSPALPRRREKLGHGGLKPAALNKFDTETPVAN